MQAFYPKSISQIIHKGRNGNIYKLDGVDKCVRLYEKIKNKPKYDVFEVVASDDGGTEKQLITLAHDPAVIKAYKTGKPSALANSSGMMWQPKMYEVVLEEALVCKKVVDSALLEGVSLAVEGGGHHAEYKRPLGFCTINTSAISAIYATQKLGKRTAVIDLDVHYSNGCFDILKKEKNILVTSIWNKKLDKWKNFQSKGNIWHKFVVDSSEYFSALGKLFVELERWKPTFVVYHLGMDVLETDRMGGILNFSFKDLYKREKLVSEKLNSLTVPYAIFLGGCYIDYSKGENPASRQKKMLTDFQYKALSYHHKGVICQA